MTIISLIAAIDMNRGIGFKQSLLCHLPADLKYFKEMTLGKPIIMGRATFESIGKPLPNRRNIVLSHRVNEIPGVEVFGSLQQAIEKLHQYDEVMVIGGGQLFEESLAIADKIYLTEIHHQFTADVFFPEFDRTQWIMKTDVLREADEKNPYNLSFKLYERANKDKKR